MNSRIAGHYARKGWDLERLSPRPKLLRPLDRTKDQTYYLSAIPESSLARTLFPLAPYTKEQTKQMARDWELPTADRPESMGICFVGEKRRFDTFICACLSYFLPVQMLNVQYSRVHPSKTWAYS